MVARHGIARKGVLPRGLLRGFAQVARAAGLVLALSGCILDLEKPDLELAAPPAYREARGGATNAALPPLDWWRTFRSPELTTLVQQAMNNNFDIAVAIAQILQADAQVRIVGASLLPTVDFNGIDEASKSSAQLGGSGASGSVGGGRSLYSRLYTTNLSASYVVDFWGKNKAALNAAMETAIGNRYNREVVTLTTLATVADTYFQIIAAQERLRIARRDLADASRILFLIQQQFGAGTASDLNVAQQESLVESVRASIPPLQEIERQNFDALAVLVGKSPEQLRARGTLVAGCDGSSHHAGAALRTLNQRPDVRLAEQQLASANFSVQSAKAAFFPTVQLTGQLGFESAVLKSLFGPGAWYYTALASLSQPIFDGGVLLGQLEQQKGLQLQYLQNYRKTILSAFSNVDQALVAIQETTEQERIQENVVKASRRAFVLSEQQMTAGTVNMVTLLQVEQTLFTAEDLLAQDQLSRLLAAVGLFQALGGGWPPKSGPPVQ